jgi:hypothetical protein
MGSPLPCAPICGVLTVCSWPALGRGPPVWGLLHSWNGRGATAPDFIHLERGSHSLFCLAGLEPHKHEPPRPTSIWFSYILDTWGKISHPVWSVRIYNWLFLFSSPTLSLILQLLDLPGIIEGAKDGKGRGRQVIAGEGSRATVLGCHSFPSVCCSCSQGLYHGEGRGFTWLLTRVECQNLKGPRTAMVHMPF